MDLFIIISNWVCPNFLHYQYLKPLLKTNKSDLFLETQTILTMKKLFTLSVMVFKGLALLAQDPSIIWQKTIGGNAMDLVYSLKLTTDGGYVLGGYSNSNASGEKSENSRGGLDAWIVKTNGNGSIVWDKTIGGNGDDFLTSVQETSDGGFIIGLGSNSNISGEKSENSRGGLDYWIVKLNDAGEIEWQKTYGGAQPEFDTHVFQTGDGGYFVSGYSDSNVSGDKTDPSNGQRDYWVMKLNSSGNIIWQNSIGGSTVDRGIHSIPSDDGGFLIGGHSDSNISGDKSENGRGAFDNWLVKLDASGNIEWNKTYGGNSNDIVRDMIQISDGFIVAGYSESGASGDKTGESRGAVDFWLYKISNTGSMVWQQTIGGSQVDYLRTIRQKSDGNFVVTGYSNSNTSGEKSDDSNGGYDMWFLLLNSSGNILGQNTIGGAGDESAGYSIVLDDGYIFAVASDSNQSGDKSENSRGEEDYWLFKTTGNLLGTIDLSQQPMVSIYPNPVREELNLEFEKVYEQIELNLFDVTGKLIRKHEFSNSQKEKIQLNLPSGVYVLQIQLDQNKRMTKKIIVL